MWGNPTMVNEVRSKIGPIVLARVPETTFRTKSHNAT